MITHPSVLVKGGLYGKASGGPRRDPPNAHSCALAPLGNYFLIWQVALTFPLGVTRMSPVPVPLKPLQMMSLKRTALDGGVTPSAN